MSFFLFGQHRLYYNDLQLQIYILDTQQAFIFPMNE